MKTNINRIKAIINKHMDILHHDYHVKDIGVFGSIVRGQDTDLSDIDLLVEFSEPIGFFKFVQLEEYLSKILNRNVDLVTKNALKPAIRGEVLQEVIYV